MEFCERGDLWNEIRRHRKGGTRFEEKQVWDTGFQLLLALHDCHSRPEKILHRDIKPANIFIDRLGTVKLGDFGLARVLGKVRWSRVTEHRNTLHVTRHTSHVTRHTSHVTRHTSLVTRHTSLVTRHTSHVTRHTSHVTRHTSPQESFFAHTNVGTPFYMSPEQINEKSDMWSLGCLLYECCALHPPFEASNQLALAMKIKTGRFDRIPACFSDELQRFIRALIEVEQVWHARAHARTHTHQLIFATDAAHGCGASA